MHSESQGTDETFADIYIILDTCYPAVSHVQAWTLIWTNLSTDLYIMSIPLPVREFGPPLLSTIAGY